MALTITFVLRDFAEWTSIPGPVQIIYALNSFIRFLWVVIWLSLFGIFVYQFYLIIDKLLEKDAEINISFNFKMLKFPVITICNENPYKLPIIKNDSRYEEVARLVEAYTRIVQNNYSKIGDDFLLFENASSPFEVEQWAQELFRMFSIKIPRHHRLQASYSISELIRHCTFNGRECDKNDFSLYVDDTYGACFRFNLRNESLSIVPRAGISYGLRMVLTSMQTMPDGTELHLPMIKTSGFRFSAEYGIEVPIIDTFGENLITGHEHYVALKLYETELMPKPYGQCSDEVDERLYNFYDRNSYVLSDCLRSCNQQRAINYCGCADPRYKAPPQMSYCGIEKLHCLIKIRGQSADQIFNALRDCNCLPTCHKYTVEKEISSSAYPFLRNFVDRRFSQLSRPWVQNYISPQLYGSPVLQNRNILPFGVNSGSFNVSRNISIENRIIFQISKNENTSFIYSISQASNDLGGQVSLWLGASVISVIEIITLMIMIILFFVHGRNVRVIPTVEEYNKDSRYRHIQELKSELDAHERMDQELLNRIERHRCSQNTQRVELQRQLHDAEIMRVRAIQEAAAADSTFAADPTDLRRRANVANARAILQATERHYQNVRNEISANYS